MAAKSGQGRPLVHHDQCRPGRPGFGHGAQTDHAAQGAQRGHHAHQRGDPAGQPGHDPLSAHPGQTLAAGKGGTVYPFRHGGLPAPAQSGLRGHFLRPDHRPPSPDGPHGLHHARGLLRHPARHRRHQHHDDPLSPGSAHAPRPAAGNSPALRHPHGHGGL